MLSAIELMRLLWDRVAARDSQRGWIRYEDWAILACTRSGHTSYGKPSLGSITIEWYRPEGYDDDDASVTGFVLPSRAGQTRVAKRIHVMAGPDGQPDWAHFEREGGQWNKIVRLLGLPAELETPLSWD